jgi:hypothetical protein
MTPDPYARLVLGVDPCACGRLFGPGEECLVRCGVCGTGVAVCQFPAHPAACSALPSAVRAKERWRRFRALIQRLRHGRT